MALLNLISPARIPKQETDAIRRRWYHWYHPDDSKEERWLIFKLDPLITFYAFVVYWVKYLDQANISA
jgi:hypothetical protein